MAALAPAPGAEAAPRPPASPAQAARAKLRVGVFAEHALQPRWRIEALAKVAASDDVELAIVVNKGVRVVHSMDSRASGNDAWRMNDSDPFILRMYRKLDRLLFGGDWEVEHDVAALVPRARRVEGFDRAAIEALGLDVAVALDDVDEGALEGLARYGTWRYCFGEEHGTRAPLAGVREVMDAAPVVASGIRIHRGGGEPDRIACRSWSRTQPFSLARCREGFLPKTAEFLARALRDLRAQGPAWIELATQPVDAVVLDTSERPRASLRGLSRVGLRVARRTAERYLTVGQWTLAYRFGATPDWGGDLDGWVHLKPSRDRFWADPFPIARDGRHFIFFEELPFAAGKAHISAIEVGRDGRASEPLRVLERDYHLSYPFLVEDEGELFMIPEAAHNHTVEIYRCVQFPHRWHLERVLLRGVWAADATLHRQDGRWWMFLAMGPDGGEVNDELHLYSSDRLLGHWKPHRGNPVKSDVRGSRPAGRLFTHGGSLYRPAQVCTPIYGAGIAVNRVTRLDEDGYAEREERRIVPAERSILGIHTLNRDGDLTVTDAFVRRARFPAP